MNRHVRFAPEAADEVAAAKAWYDHRVPGLGDAFLGAFEAAVEAVRIRPAAYPVARRVRGHPVRRKPLARFPFQLVYLESTDGALVILALAHQRRRPGYWRSRF